MTSKFNTKTAISASLILSLALLGTLAIANDKSKFLKLYDINSDKKVTQSEFEFAAKERFNAIDINRDQEVDKAEFKNWRAKTQHSKKRYRLGKADVNADGQISEAEFLHSRNRGTKRRFDLIDVNHDGNITRAELNRFQKVKYYPKKHHNKLFKKFDYDKNNTISQAESLAVWSKLFNRLDANNDAVVTEQEIEFARRK